LGFLPICSHLIHTPYWFLPASGLRLEIAFHFDKKKPEFYFSLLLKKLLTENGISKSRGSLSGEYAGRAVDPAVALTQH
jgi:hypothetical protein